MKDTNYKLQMKKNKGFTQHQFYYSKTSAGFTLLMATLVSSLLLSLGISIFNIALKEIKLSSYGRDSQFAFYSADTGAECALYWDRKKESFATSSASSQIFSGLNCNNQDITVSDSWNIVTRPSSAVTTFSLLFPPDSYCAIVTVDKTGGKTTIESRGYNSCDTNNSRRVERGIRVTY